ncbi:glycosyltransferase family 39 protein [archaeon]|nr:glycosyltransferase family 39 protein [archaeon]
MDNQDSYWYTRLSENSMSGKGYTLDGSTPHAQYPPGLPSLIFIFSILFKNSITAGLVMVFFLSLASIILAYKIGKEINKDVGIISAVLLATHNLFLFHSLTVLTQIPFMFFSTLGLYLFMKSYEKRILIIPAIASVSLSILIRYDGFLLAIPLIFYVFMRRKDFEKFLFSKKTFMGIGTGILILAPWFLRNFFTFGNFLVNTHSSGDGSTGLSLVTLFQFFSLFFKTGYIFPYLVILGILMFLLGAFKSSIKSKKSLELKTYLVWMLVYFLLHSWWWARGVTYYAQLLIFFCLFGALFIKNISKFFSKKIKKISQQVFIYSILLLLILSQIFIFSSGSIQQQLSVENFNKHDPIMQVSEYSNQNLPDDAVYVFPEYVVYSFFLKKSQSTTYMDGFNYLLSTNGTIYFFTDNIYTWITDPFIPKNGKILLTVPTPQGTNVNVALYPEEIATFEKDSELKTISATVWKIEGFYVMG